MSGSSNRRGGRGHVAALAWALAVLPLGVLSLAACSVPREADLAAAASPNGVPSSSPSLSLDAPAPVSAASVTPSASPVPRPSPTLAPVKPPVPKAVKGYRLSTAPRSVPNPMARVKGANEVFGATTVRSVSTKGTPVGLVFLFAVRPQYYADSQVTGAVVSRLASSISRSGVRLTEQRWSGRRVCAGSSDKNGTIAIWYRHGVLTVVAGADPGVVTAYAKRLVAVS